MRKLYEILGVDFVTFSVIISSLAMHRYFISRFRVLWATSLNWNVIKL